MPLDAGIPSPRNLVIPPRPFGRIPPREGAWIAYRPWTAVPGSELASPSRPPNFTADEARAADRPGIDLVFPCPEAGPTRRLSPGDRRPACYRDGNRKYEANSIGGI